MHAAIQMARRQLPAMLPKQLVWPYDCQRRCNELEHVVTGPAVADEMTRHLREPYKSIVREEYR